MAAVGGRRDTPTLCIRFYSYKTLAVHMLRYVFVFNISTSRAHARAVCRTNLNNVLYPLARHINVETLEYDKNKITTITIIIRNLKRDIKLNSSGDSNAHITVWTARISHAKSRRRSLACVTVCACVLERGGGRQKATIKIAHKTLL